MRSSKPRRRIPRWPPPHLWLPLPARIAAQLLFLYLILVRKCHSVAHRQDRRASRRRRTVPPKLILPHVAKANPKVNLLPDSLVKVYLTWVLRAVRRNSRLSRPIEGSSIWFHSLDIHHWASYIPHFLCCLLPLNLTFFLFFCMDHFCCLMCCD